MKQLKCKMGHIKRESGVEQAGVAIDFYLTPMRVPGFRKTPLYHKQEHTKLKEEFVSGFTEGERCVCCWSAWHQCLNKRLQNTPYTLYLKFKPISLCSLKNVL